MGGQREGKSVPGANLVELHGIQPVTPGRAKQFPRAESTGSQTFPESAGCCYNTHDSLVECLYIQ